MHNTVNPSLSLLRIVCAIQVFFIHYFAYIGWREYIWIYNLAVPTFLLMSAYLYGLKEPDQGFFVKSFLFRRYVTLASSVYPYLIIALVVNKIEGNIDKFDLVWSFVRGFLFLFAHFKNMPFTGHLWFISLLAICYISLAIFYRYDSVKDIFKSSRFVFFLFFITLMLGGVYRGNEIPYVFGYLFVFYNAKSIQKLSRKIKIYQYVLLLSCHFLLSSTEYTIVFHSGIYVGWYQMAFFSLVAIMFFDSKLKKISDNRLVVLLGGITLDFYLMHGLFVGSSSWMIGMTLTIIASIPLWWIGKKIRLYALTGPHLN